MAKVLDSFEFAPAGRVSKYPWHEWLDGRVWALTAGEDFGCSVSSMKSNIATAASKRDLDVRINAKDKNTVVLQASSKS